MKTAILTLEPLTAPVANMQAGMASLTGVSRVNGYQIDTISKTFISNKLTQLVERPTVRASTLSLVPWLLIGSISDAGQVLNGDCRLSLYRPSNDCHTNVVVLPGLISTLFAGEPFQEAFRSFFSA